jgi:hypothetical protein
VLSGDPYFYNLEYLLVSANIIEVEGECEESGWMVRVPGVVSLGRRVGWEGGQGEEIGLSSCG